jgi:hypothetical protein
MDGFYTPTDATPPTPKKAKPTTEPRPTPRTDDELFERLAEMEKHLAREQAEDTKASKTTKRFILTLAIVGGAIALLFQQCNVPTVVTELPSPARLVVDQTPADDWEGDLNFAEQQVERFLHETQTKGEVLLANLHCVTVESFRADARELVAAQGISERAAYAQKLNFTIGVLGDALSKRGFFNGRAESRELVRAPLLDSLAATYALAGMRGECPLMVADYLDSLELLSSWIDRAEAKRREWQLRDRLQPPAPKSPALDSGNIREATTGGGSWGFSD